MNFITAPYLRFKNEVGSQDLIKFLALATMIIDHLGLMFFINDPVFRAIGRCSSIMWFFFVGYNYRKRSLVNELLFCAVIFFALSKYLFHIKTLPLNILFSMIICRVALDYYSVKCKELDLTKWFIIATICFLLFLITNCFFEYGTLGILTAIWGYNLKHNMNNKLLQTLTVSVVSSICQIYIFHFTFYNAIIAFILINLTIYLLYRFKPITLNIHGIFKYIINISSRYSLYLYCFHLLLFFYIKAKL